MGIQEQEVINHIIEKTDSILILFFILILIAGVIVFIPLYKLVLKNRTEQNQSQALLVDQTIKREAQLLKVITKNTEIISELKTLLSVAVTDITDSNHTLHKSLLTIDEKLEKLYTMTSLIDNNLKHVKDKTTMKC